MKQDLKLFHDWRLDNKQIRTGKKIGKARLENNIFINTQTWMQLDFWSCSCREETSAYRMLPTGRVTSFLYLHHLTGYHGNEGWSLAKSCKVCVHVSKRCCAMRPWNIRQMSSDTSILMTPEIMKCIGKQFSKCCLKCSINQSLFI